MTKITELLFLTFLILFPSISVAELSFCNGVWTNQACEDEEESEKSLEEIKKKPPTEAEKNSSLKKSILHEVTQDRIEARRKYDVIVPSSSAEKICQDAASKVSACQEAADKYSSRLQSRVESALKAKELEAKKEKESDEAKKKDNNTTVVVVNPEPRRRGVPVDYEYVGGNRVRTESGVSINVSGQSSDGRISGGISAGSRVIQNDFLKKPRVVRGPQKNILTNDFRKKNQQGVRMSEPVKKPLDASNRSSQNMMNAPTKKAIAGRSPVITAPKAKSAASR